MQAESEIAKWYRGKAVFITGATGFMGKVLVAKLLRSCPDIGPIYILVREKKKMLPRDRVEQILTSAVFDEIRGMKTHRTDWLFPILGDIGLPDLGISAEDRRLLQEKVSVVFHLAATVRFDEPLRNAAAINLVGTRALMELCLEITNLSAIVHVSTAYANCILSSIEEYVYAPPLDLDKVMDCIAGMDDELLDSITPRLIGSHPNTYTFTKALAEHLVAGYSTKLPIAVVRPSIVIASWKEPEPGWVDSYHGPTSIVVGAGKGLLTSVYGKKEAAADLVPVDVCVNLFIAVAWKIGTRDGTTIVPDVPVYNCVSRPYNPITWGFFVEVIDTCIREYALSDTFMSPSLIMTDCRVEHTLTNLVGRALPAALVDYFSWITGGKPRLQRFQRKINQVAEIFNFFTTNEWQFEVENVKRLKERMSPVDREIFDFDMTQIIWKDYVTSYFMGIRRNVTNDEDETLDSARKRIARVSLITKIARFGALGIFGFGVMSFYQVSLISVVNS